MSSFDQDILPATCGLRLCKIIGDDDLRLAQEVIFEGGREAVILTLRRAQISGHVGGSIDQTTNFWADQFSADGNHIGEIRLDRGSWNALKNRWMPCAMLVDRPAHTARADRAEE